MKERVLITGASGFVGYHLIIEALHNNLEVFAAVRKSSRIDHLKEFDIQYVYPDFSSVTSLKKDILEKKYNYVIHAAGVTRARNAKEYNTINADYTANLAQAVIDTGQNIKFVFVSSLAAIGPLNNIEGIITEGTPPNPITAYGKSKLLAEQKLRDLSGLNYTILRPTAVYGPRDTGIYIFFKQLSKGIEPYIGRAEQILSFIYVADLAKACFKALHNGDNQTYNLSDNHAYNRYELGNAIKEISGRKTAKFHLSVNFVKLIAAIAEKVSSLSNKSPILNIEKLNELTGTNWACSIEAARNDLGYDPQYNLQAGVKETIKWYKAHKWL
jgi:UDP-glucose 4-epimerase